MQVQFKHLKATVNLETAIQYEELQGECDAMQYAVANKLAAKLDEGRDGSVVKMYVRQY